MDKIEIKEMLRDMSDSQLLKMVLQDRKKYNNKTLSAAIEILHERNVDIEYDKYRASKKKIKVRIKDNKKDEVESKEEIISKQEELNKDESISNDQSISAEKESREKERTQKKETTETGTDKQEIVIKKNVLDRESKEEPNEEFEQIERKEKQDSGFLDKTPEPDQKEKEDIKKQNIEHIDIEKKEKLNVKQKLKIKEDVWTEENEAEIESAEQKKESVFTRIKQKAKNVVDDIFVFWHYFKLGFLSLLLAVLLAAVVFFAIMAFFEFGTSYVLLFLAALLFVILLILIMYRIFALLNGINNNYTGINKLLENFTEEDLEKLKDIN